MNLYKQVKYFDSNGVEVYPRQKLDWQLFLAGLFLGITIFLTLFMFLYIAITSKDMHKECNKGNHEWEKFEYSNVRGVRCKNCGLTQI